MDVIRQGKWEPIVFFDVEVEVKKQGQHRILLEFGAIFVCPARLIEIDSYSTLIQPHDPSVWNTFCDRSNGITREALASAPPFSQVADTIYEILNGRIWAGHNIKIFDCVRIEEAFAEIGRKAPRYRLLIDTLSLLTDKFGRRAGDMKLASLAEYFGFGEPPHRSLPDIRKNLEILRHCGAILFMEFIFPDVLPKNTWVPLYDVSLPCTSVIVDSLNEGNRKIRITHNSIDLKLYCSFLKVCYGINKFDDANPRLTFMVDASSPLRKVLDECDRLAANTYKDSGGGSEWFPVVNRKYKYPAVRLRLRVDGDIDNCRTQVERYQKRSSTIQRVVYSNFDYAELASLVVPETSVDAYFSVYTFDYKEKAGIILVADRLIINEH